MHPLPHASPPPDPHGEERDADILSRLQAKVSPRRLWHCQKVAELAESLARRWALDPHLARRAGLVHDICRENRDPQRDAAQEGLALPDWAGEDFGALHGPLAAVLARREFGLPEAWCRAIAGHTTGRPGMGPEEMVLYVADHAAEGRRHPHVPHWRELAQRDLGAATLEMLTQHLADLLSKGAPLWPPTVLARNQLLRHPAG